MTNRLNQFFIFVSLNLLIGCSQILQTVDLEINAKDDSVQENFRVVEKTLSLKEAKLNKTFPYRRQVMQHGLADKADLILEPDFIKSEFPSYVPPKDYKVGNGDTLVFTKLIEHSFGPNEEIINLPKNEKEEDYILGIGDQITLIQMNKETLGSNSFSLNSSSRIQEDNLSGIAAIENLPNEKDVFQTTGRIGSDGSILLLEVGRLEAVGKTINNLRSEVRNILIRNGISPKFQLEITAFNSQKAFLTINSNLEDENLSLTNNGSGGVIQLTDRPLTMREILSRSGVSIKPGVETFVHLQRKGSNFRLNLNEIYSPGKHSITIKDQDHIFVTEGVSNISEAKVKVGSDGNVLIPDVGKIKVAGKSVKMIENEINRLSNEKSSLWKDFQIRVIGFDSQRAIVNIPKSESDTQSLSKVLVINDKLLRLDEVLTENGVTIKENTLTKIHLFRNGISTSFLFDDLFLDPSKKIFLQGGDRIRVEQLKYKKNKVFIMGSGIEPMIFYISPANRETLADALFTQNGALRSSSAMRSDIYLLRGRDPIIAYHLNALNPSRLLIAEEMELRPNDILFVAEQPIISFNRTMQTLFPLRILLRDIDNQNIP